LDSLENNREKGSHTDWRSMARPALDRAYNNAAAVADSAQKIAAWDQKSALLRSHLRCQLDIPYGDKPRQRIDYFPSSDVAPTLVFFHGGYWQTRSKENFTFIVEGPLSVGLNVAMIGYTLAPDAKMAQIIDECATALEFLVDRQSLFKSSGPLLVSGWSAGAHLAAMMVDRPGVKAALGISGVYDLEPIRHTYLNEKLGLDDAAVRDFSPFLAPRQSDRPMWIVAGQAELPELRRQSREYAVARRASGSPGGYDEIPGADHFSILQGLSSPSGLLIPMLKALVRI
jgi:acetyl esterase/lipase